MYIMPFFGGRRKTGFNAQMPVMVKVTCGATLTAITWA